MTDRFLDIPLNHSGEVPIFMQQLCRTIIRLMGWQFESWVLDKDMKKAVIIGEHHTSNMDGVLMILAMTAVGRRFNWLAKIELFNGPLGWIVRKSGGIAVDRKHAQGIVGSIVHQFKERDHMLLVLSPKATRSKVNKWRTGFYYMASQSDVPIGLGYLNYGKKALGIGEMMTPSGDILADEPIFQEFYKDIVAKNPDMVGEIRLIPPKAYTNRRKAEENA